MPIDVPVVLIAMHVGFDGTAAMQSEFCSQAMKRLSMYIPASTMAMQDAGGRAVGLVEALRLERARAGGALSKRPDSRQHAAPPALPTQSPAPPHCHWDEPGNAVAQVPVGWHVEMPASELGERQQSCTPFSQ